MIAALTAILLTWLHITILGIVSTPALVIQLVIIAIVLSFRYEQSRFGWQVALIAGLLFDLFSGLRFGVFISLFVVAAMLSESAFTWSEKWGLALTTWVVTAVSTLLYMGVVMSLAGYPFTDSAKAVAISVLATVIALQAIASLLDHFNKSH